MDLSTLNTICFVWIGMAAIVHIAMFFVTAPFGRHSSDKWGPSIDNRLGWFLMELPSLAIMVWFALTGSNSLASFSWMLFALWIFHYINRTFIYPLRMRPTPKRMPLFIVLNAVIFNVMNAGLNGYYLAELAPPSDYGISWLANPVTLFGFALFVAGLGINWISDGMLFRLRKPGETGYKIPQGFLFRYVAAPNLFGEIVEWCGFALMAWNLPALTFMVWTFANLIPRAKNHYDWYKRTFPDFPKDRKAIFPFLF